MLLCMRGCKYSSAKGEIVKSKKSFEEAFWCSIDEFCTNQQRID